MHTIKAILVATLWETEPMRDRASPSAATRCCKRGEPMTAESQRANVRIAAAGAGAGRRASTSW